MAYYVYRVTNTINQKFYIGKRKHPEPIKDKYMGSGKLIKQAILKYGIENFIKEILNVFDTDHEAALLESQLINRHTIKNPLCYNMHEGGKGGWSHINDGSKEHRERAQRGGKVSIQKLMRKISSGECNNPRFEKNSTYAMEMSRKANTIKKELWAKDNTKRESFIAKVSGKSNHSKGQLWCVPLDDPRWDNRKRFDPDHIPQGYVSYVAFKEQGKNKSGAYGYKWYHDPTTKQNFFLKEALPNLKRGKSSSNAARF